MTVIGDLVTRFTVEGMDGVHNAVAQYGKEVDAAKKENQDFDKGLSILTDKIAAVVAGLTIAVAFLGSFISKAAEFGDAIKDLSYQTGMNTDQVQKWQEAATVTGVEFTRLTQTMRMMSQRLTEADVEGSAMADALTRLGVTARDQYGNIKDIDTIMKELILALSKIPEGAERNALAMDVFGKSWADIAPLISEADRALAAYEEKDPFSKEKIEAMDKAKQKMGEISSRANDIAVAFGTRLLPLLDFVDWGSSGIVKLVNHLETGFNNIERHIGNLNSYLRNPYGGFTQYSDMLDTVARNKVLSDNAAASAAEQAKIDNKTGKPGATKESVLRKSLEEEIQINLYAIEDYQKSIDYKKEMEEDFAEDKKERDKLIAETELQINHLKNQKIKDMWKSLKENIENAPVQAFIDIQAALTMQKGGGDSGGLPGGESKGWNLGGSTWNGIGVGSKGSEMQIFMKAMYEAGYNYQDALNYWGESAGGADARLREIGVWPQRASGGPVMAGGQYIVGEYGPELFSPDQNGTILPNNMIGSTCNITIELDGETIAKTIAAPLVGEIRVRTGVRF